MNLETIGLGIAALIAPMGVMFMLMCRIIWLDFLGTTAFKDVEALRSDEVFPKMGALVSNFIFIVATVLFSLGMTLITLILGMPLGVTALTAVAPLASLFVVMLVTAKSPIGIPFDNLKPPIPAVVVFGGSSAVLLASLITAANAGTYTIETMHMVVLAVAIVVPNLVALRHRRAGWLNQPKPKA